VDFTKDRFHIAYDPKQLPTEKILETIRKQGFEGEVFAEEKMKDGE
jgi:hypothetical protein